MKDYQKEIAQLLVGQNINLSEEELVRAIEIPPNMDLGDYAFPCFLLAKSLRKSPQLIAEELAANLQADWLDHVEAKGPYVNFFLATNALADDVINQVLREGDRFGSSDEGKDQTVCTEFSSTNIAKPFHIGHIRSTVQGDALASIYEFLGYDTVRINYLGDYGTQFGMLINAYELWGDEKALEEDAISELLRLYVQYNKEAETKPELLDAARERFYQLEQGADREMALWKRFKDVSLKEFQRVYDLLNIRFDSWDGEFFHAQFIDQLLEELHDKDLLVKDDGAMIIPLGDDMPPAMIVKSNGSSTYLTRDIATALYRKRTYDFVESLYVVGSQQSLHFKQLKRVLEKMGYDWAKQIEHIPFGMISLAEGSMSTRSGKVVFLEDVLNNAIKKTREIMDDRNPDLENRDEVAKQVGIGAVKFQELLNNRVKDYVFSWDEILNFDGETGPYVQYTAARAWSVTNRAEKELEVNAADDISFSHLQLSEEHNIIRQIYEFPGVISTAQQKKEPSIITRHLVEIAKAFNKFYGLASILNAESSSLALERYRIVKATRQVLEIGLGLLGIASPQKM